MNYFKKYNILTGWAAFAVTVIVHFLTMEPSASLWDCPEYISTAYKLEVGHPPGAPLFLMIARLFAMLAPSPEYVAYMTNLMAVICSGFTILFMFWSITHFGRKIYGLEPEQLSKGQVWTVLGAGLVGALAYTFSDTFWFSSVETETYALASAMVAAAVWAMLKWESVADQPGSTRWLIVIAFLLGLSIGVRIIPLLTIPALAFIYYFKKYPVVTWKGILCTSLIAFGIIFAIYGVIMPLTLRIGASMDKLFVNGLGLPINTGLAFTFLLILGLCAWGMWYSHKRGKAVLNTVFVCTALIMLGFSTYAATVIRAVADPPMNSNNPNNAYALRSFINREQYGSRPLVYGHWYSSPAIDYSTRTVHYVDDDGKYASGETISKIIYPSEFKTLFPRMWDPSKADAYQAWANVTGKIIPYRDERITVPTFGENLGYFFNYQLNFMYWRYFLWNFVGRQSDVQSTGSLTDGNWISGFKAIDELYLGPQDNLPSELANNKGRNKYYFLPFLLGLIGLLYQLNRDSRNFTVILWLFFMMGIAVIMYFNPTPGEPRERDYIFSGSFYAFCLWIGLGVMCVKELIMKLTKKDSVATAAIATAVCAVVPIILAAQNWDDHDRSNRYVARDIGWNYLQSCLPNSIILNFGDNDTFPLWYNQEVEGVRLDVKIMNMSYLGMDWYVDQMKVASNDAAAVPFSLPRSKYVSTTNESIMVYSLFDYPVDIRQVIDFIRREGENTKLPLSDGSLEDFIPAKQLILPVNKQNAVASGIVRAEDAHLMEDSIIITLEKNRLYRHEMMFLDLLANFDWNRPLFFTQVYALKDFGLTDYLQFDGYSYRLVPIKTPVRSALDLGRIDTEYLYNNLMNVFRYGNVSDPKVYNDHYIQHNMHVSNSRNAYALLAKGLIAEGDTIRAIEVLDAGLEKVPLESMRFFYKMTVPHIEAYYLAGDFDKGNEVLTAYAENLMEYLVYYTQFDGRKYEKIYDELVEKFSYLDRLQHIASIFGQQDHADWIADFFDKMGFS